MRDCSRYLYSYRLLNKKTKEPSLCLYRIWSYPGKTCCRSRSVFQGQPYRLISWYILNRCYEKLLPLIIKFFLNFVKNDKTTLQFTGELRRCQTHLVRLNGIQNVPLAHFAFTAQLRPNVLRFRWVLPHSRRLFNWQNPLRSQTERLWTVTSFSNILSFTIKTSWLLYVMIIKSF